MEALSSYQHIQDPEVLHQIRVEIKKIKAVLNVINYCVGKFKGHQHFLTFRTIFRQAGAIRQPDVFYKLLLQYQISGVVDAQLPSEKEINALSVTFQKTVPQLNKTIESEKKELHKYYDKIESRDAKDYLKKQRVELTHYLFPRITKTSLHKVRKIVKEILYLHRVIRHRKPAAFYNEAEYIIGQWHDKQMLLTIVRKSNQTDEINKLVSACKADLIHLRSIVSNYYNGK